MSRITFEKGENDINGDDYLRLKKRKVGSNVLESCENTMMSKEDAKSCESIGGQSGQKRKRGINSSTSNLLAKQEAPSPSPVKMAIKKSSSSLRAAVTKVQNRKPLPSFSHVCFARPLNEVVGVDQELPLVVEEAIRFLIPKYLSEEGLFRKSGSQQSIQSIRSSIDATGQIRDIINSESDCHAIAGVLKLFIRELPESLIPSELHDKFLCVIRDKEIASDLDAQLVILNSALADLERSSYSLVKQLCVMNYQISLRHEENLMTPNNLARVWAPNMIKPESTNAMQLIQFTEQANILVTIMIQHAPHLFQVESMELFGTDDSACMAASASYDDSMTTPTIKSSFNINHNNSTSNIQIGMRQKTMEMLAQLNEATTEYDDSDLDLARSSSEVEKKTISSSTTEKKRQGLIKKTSVLGKSLIKGTPTKNAMIEENNKELMLELKALKSVEFKAPTVESNQLNNSNSNLRSSTKGVQLQRTKSSVFKDLKKNISQSDNSEREETSGGDPLYKSASSKSNSDLTPRNMNVKPKIALLYYEPNNSNWIDQKIKDSVVPKLKHRQDSKSPISVEEATKLTRTCKSLFIIENDSIVSSRSVSEMTDLEIKKSVISIDTFNLKCPSLMIKNSKKDNLFFIGYSQFIWESVLENEDSELLNC